jgi:hypothetical protein
MDEHSSCGVAMATPGDRKGAPGMGRLSGVLTR